MSTKIALAALAVATLALPSVAAARSPLAPAAKPKNNCFWANSVSNFRAADESTVFLRVGVKDVYRLDMLSRCHEIDWTQKIGILSRGSNRVCTGLDAELITPSPIGPMRCAVKTVTKLTPEEVALLPKGSRP
jgi:hypothetical protein